MRKLVTSCQPFWPAMKNKAADWLSSWLEWVLFFFPLLNAWERRAAASSWLNAFNSISTTYAQTPLTQPQFQFTYMHVALSESIMNIHHMCLFLFTKHHKTFHHTGESLVLSSTRPHTVSHSDALFNCLSLYLVSQRVCVWFEPAPGLSD